MIREKSKLLFVIFVLIILSGIFYYYENYRIPNVITNTTQEIKKEIDINAMPKKLVAVVTDPQGIAKYTEITQEIIDQKIIMTEIPIKFIPNGAVNNIQDILGKITKEELRLGEQLIIDNFSKEEKWFDDFERLKEFSIISTVANELKSGNIVDILVVYGNGDYDVVVSKVKIKNLVEGKIEDNSDIYAQIVIPVNETQIRNLIAADKLGDLTVRIYLDESQKASKETFNYEKAKQQLRFVEANEKGGDM